MRLDKFLKVSRIIKRRTIAKEVTEAGAIEVNGSVAKPGQKLEEGDIVKINYKNGPVTLEVLSLNNSPKKEEAANMYKIIEREKNE